MEEGIEEGRYIKGQVDKAMVETQDLVKQTGRKRYILVSINKKGAKDR